MQAVGVLLALMLWSWLTQPREPVPSACALLLDAQLAAQADQHYLPAEGCRPVTDLPGPPQWPLIGNLCAVQSPVSEHGSCSAC